VGENTTPEKLVISQLSFDEYDKDQCGFKNLTGVAMS
jgi:hypothetical protein